MDEIVENTNKYITKVQTHYKEQRHAETTNFIEINSLFGLLYFAGLHKSSHVHVRDLWATDGTGIEIFPVTMSFTRFQFLMQCLRFDDLETRHDRRQFDKLAPIRDVLDKFNKNCEKNYNVGCFVTVDEKLESFRGRCSFRQYIPNKPAKYGIKIFSAVDAIAFYTSRLEVYCGQQPLGPYNLCNKPEAVVKRITSHLQGNGRNITIDNWFTSYPLAQDLLKNKTTVVGTIKKNKRILPPLFSCAKNRDIKSTIFGYQKNSTILSYVPKKNKVVLLLSTMHAGAAGEIISGPKSLPEIIDFYNKTKGGVDTTDQLCATYNVARNARRWPLVIFFSLMNLAAINARIVLLCTKDAPIANKKRSQFIKDLAFSLCQPQIDKRKQFINLRSSLKCRIEKYATKVSTESTSTLKIQNREKRSRCQLCDVKKDRKTKTTCYNCAKYICGEHTISLCSTCYELPNPCTSSSDVSMS